MLTRRRLFLFPFALTLHNLEELLFLPQWTRQNSAPLTLSTPSFTSTIFLITLLAYLLWGLLFFKRFRHKAEQLLMGYVGAMFLNIFFPHLLGSLLYGEILPGTATALLCILPTSLYLFKSTTQSFRTVVIKTGEVSLFLIVLIMLALFTFS